MVLFFPAVKRANKVEDTINRFARTLSIKVLSIWRGLPSSRRECKVQVQVQPRVQKLFRASTGTRTVLVHPSFRNSYSLLVSFSPFSSFFSSLSRSLEYLLVVLRTSLKIQGYSLRYRDYSRSPFALRPSKDRFDDSNQLVSIV